MDKSKVVEKIHELYKTWAGEREDVEEIWQESYDAFRGVYDSAVIEKWRKLEGKDWRSKVFVRLTKMKVVSAVSQIEDIYFQGGELPFDIKPSPVPEDMQGQILIPQDAEQRAERMKAKIKDVYQECNMVDTLTKAILELAVYGMGILMAPVLETGTRTKYRLMAPPMAQLADLHLGTNLVAQHGRHVPIEEKVSKLVVKFPSLWNCFWDMEEEDGFSNSRGVIIREWMSADKLRDLMDRPGYDKTAIQRAISKSGNNSGQYGTDHTVSSPARENRRNKTRTIRVLNFCGRLAKEDMKDSAIYQDVTGEYQEVVATIADDELIYGPKQKPYPVIKHPLHAAYWEEIPHETVGSGIPENIKDSQYMVNSATRLFVDNKAISGNVLMAGTSGGLAPGVDKSVFPGKFFEIGKHVTDVRQALQFFTPPDVGQGLLEMINLFERFADEESNHPRFLQGETSKGDPKTAFAFSKLTEAANKALGKIIKNIDRGWMRPITESIYHWLMATDPDESIKGDYNCKATGFTAYTDRVLQGQNIQDFISFMLSNQMLSMMLNPASIEELLKARNLDPEKFLVTPDQYDQRMQSMAASMQPPIRGAM